MNDYVAFVVEAPGPPSVLKKTPRAYPEIKSGWVLIKIEGFGINRSEMFTRQGYSPNVKFPRVLGIECVGRVVESNSESLDVGSQVVALMGGMGRDYDGAYAEFALLPERVVFPIKTSLAPSVLAALPEMFQTSWGSLTAGLGGQAQQTLLIRGGTSSVGRMALQLAKILEMSVVATTRSEQKVDTLLAAGADHVWIDDGRLAARKQSAGIDIDCVLELVGTATLKDSLKICKPGGTVCMTGILGNQWTFNEFTPMEDIPHTTKLTAYSGGPEDFDRQAFQQYLQQIEAGKATPPIDRVFAFEELVAAHEYMESNQATGKIVIVHQ
ncbi:MAG: zinc-binding alcohol dehydrogenase family protein [Pseudomonadota bacterium]